MRNVHFYRICKTTLCYHIQLLWRTSTFLSVHEVDCNFKKISRFLYNCITQVKIRKLKHPVENKFPLFLSDATFLGVDLVVLL